MSGQHVSDHGGASEGFVNLHGGSPRVTEDMSHPFTFQGFHKDVTALPRLVSGEPGNEGFWGAPGGLGSDTEVAAGETLCAGRFMVMIGNGDGDGEK